jgi:hypothetical protein
MQYRNLGFATMGLAALGLAALSIPASAHHSHAMYDTDIRMVVEARVKEYIWANPHIWVYLEIPDENGRAVEWILEAAAPGRLSRAGWSAQSMKTDDVVTVTFSPLRDGTSGGLVGDIILVDGSTVSTGSLDNNTDLSDAEIFGVE